MGIETVRTYSTDEKLIRERRNQIAACAMKLFYKNGYKETTMREIAAACRMSQGAIYRWIGAKDDILRLICLQRTGGVQSLKDLIKGLGNISNTDILIACMKEYLRWEVRDKDSIVFFNREINNFSRDDRRILLRDTAGILETFETILLKGAEAGEFKTDNPKLIAHNIVMAGQDWAIREWYLSRYFTPEQYIEQQIAGILKQICINQRDKSAI